MRFLIYQKCRLPSQFPIPSFGFLHVLIAFHFFFFVKPKALFCRSEVKKKKKGSGGVSAKIPVCSSKAAHVFTWSPSYMQGLPAAIPICRCGRITADGRAELCPTGDAELHHPARSLYIQRVNSTCCCSTE